MRYAIYKITKQPRTTAFVLRSSRRGQCLCLDKGGVKQACHWRQCQFETNGDLQHQSPASFTVRQ